MGPPVGLSRAGKAGSIPEVPAGDSHQRRSAMSGTVLPLSRATRDGSTPVHRNDPSWRARESPVRWRKDRLILMATPKNNLEEAEALRRKVGIEGQGLLDSAGFHDEKTHVIHEAHAAFVRPSEPPSRFLVELPVHPDDLEARVAFGEFDRR